ncbi:MAG: lipopolysaccharide core heptose(II) kinase RfaY [Eubacterium sp.]|nr:lipopolysaccharide core heptose(II) kinase RfaY [Eubacterium sp.]
MGSNASRLKEIARVIKSHNVLAGITPEKFRLILEDLGPTYVKIGQILSTRPDILPKDYCTELSLLQNSVPPMPFEQVKKIIEDSYGRPMDDVFSGFNREPIGSASIAQVHRAVLKDESKVVVKVQRENIYSIMKEDMSLLKHIFSLLPSAIFRTGWDPEMIIDELWEVTEQEMNFETEASNMAQFAELNKGIKYIECPALYRELTTTRVLVMEYVDGIHVNDKEKLIDYGYDLNEVCTKMVDNYIKQVMDDGFFHGDPHPGNILIRGGKICWLDMGMMGRLSERDRKEIKNIITGIANQDVGAVQSSVLVLGDFLEPPNRSRLRKDLEELIRKYSSIDIGSLDVAAFMEELLGLMAEHKARMPHGMTMLARGLMHMEGVGADLTPDINIMQIAATRVRADAMSADSIKSGIKKYLKDLIQGSADLAKLPSDLRKILDDYTRNDTSIRLDLHTTEDLDQMISHNVRNIILGLWVLGLLVSSAIICTTDMTPKVYNIPALGFAGFFAAIVIAIYSFAVHLVHRNKKKKHKKKF